MKKDENIQEKMANIENRQNRLYIQIIESLKQRTKTRQKNRY